VTTPPWPLAALAAGLLACAASAQLTPDDWREDLDVLATELPAKHKNAFAVLSRDEFEKRLGLASRLLATYDDAAGREGVLVSLVAALGDSHTTVQMRALREGPLLPLKFAWFADGLRIVAAPKAHEQAAGALVKRVGLCDWLELGRRFARVQAFDNEAARQCQIPMLLTAPKLLRFLEINMDPTEVRITIEDSAGKEKELLLGPGPIGRDAAAVKPKAATVTGPRYGKWHDHQFLEKEGLLYVQYNRCETSKDFDVEKLGAALEALCAQGAVKTLVFDVQYNGGGNSVLADAVFARLARHAPMKDKKNVFCVVGRYTFSSAILNALTLRKNHGAVLVGEPTAGSPNHFGEVKTLELPKSKLKLQYSTKRFEHAPPGTTTIEPDHLAEVTYADWLAGRDVVLEKIRALVK
jgi:hypothetical protein